MQLGNHIPVQSRNLWKLPWCLLSCTTREGVHETTDVYVEPASLCFSFASLKTLVSSVHTEDPKLCCLGSRNKPYIEFALKGWGYRFGHHTCIPDKQLETQRGPGPAQCFSSREQWYAVSELSPGKQGSSQTPEKAKLRAGKLANLNARGAGLGETDDNVGSCENKTIKNTCKGSDWASFKRNIHMSKSSQISYLILAAFCTINQEVQGALVS